MKLNTLLEIEAKAQARWKDEKIFEEDAPPVNLYYTCFYKKQNSLALAWIFLNISSNPAFNIA